MRLIDPTNLRRSVWQPINIQSRSHATSHASSPINPAMHSRDNNYNNNNNNTKSNRSVVLCVSITSNGTTPHLIPSRSDLTRPHLPALISIIIIWLVLICILLLMLSLWTSLVTAVPRSLSLVLHATSFRADRLVRNSAFPIRDWQPDGSGDLYSRRPTDTDRFTIEPSRRPWQAKRLTDRVGPISVARVQSDVRSDSVIVGRHYTSARNDFPVLLYAAAAAAAYGWPPWVVGLRHNVLREQRSNTRDGPYVIPRSRNPAPHPHPNLLNPTRRNLQVLLVHPSTRTVTFVSSRPEDNLIGSACKPCWLLFWGRVRKLYSAQTRRDGLYWSSLDGWMIPACMRVGPFFSR